jgi:iron complex transport system ATP-binding protein
MTALLEAKNISYSYRHDQTVFDAVSFCVQPGEVLTLLGPNGAGKSTLLNCLAGLYPPREGQVLLDGEPLAQTPARTIAQKIAYVPQNISVTYGYSVREYLVMGAAPRLGMFETPKASDYERVDEAIATLKLEKLAKRAVDTLSGGERQRVAIARAIVQDPELILFDEPTSALDYGNQIRVMRAIKRLSERGYAIIMTTHNPDQPILLGGYVATLDRDGTYAVGSAETVLTSERLTQLYETRLHLVYIDVADRIACVSSRL